MSEDARQTVVLFDDDQSRLRRWEELLNGIDGFSDRFDTQAQETDDFASVFEALKERQLKSRDGERASRDDASILDGADIVVVDFDLTPGPGHTHELEQNTLKTLRGSFGDKFVYLTRCYTSAAATVLVNQTFFQPTFDLTLRQFETSYADLNISDRDLRNPRLWWGDTAPGEFRPWHWPRLATRAGHLRRIAEKIDLNARVLQTLGLDSPDTYDSFDPRQLDALGPGDPREATFGSLTAADAKFGRLTDKEQIDPAAQRGFAASAVTHWLERDVLAAQNILVDAPHLAQRRPNLLRDGSSIEDLSLLSDLRVQDELDTVLDLDSLAGAHTPASEWVDRPVWLWPACPPGGSAEFDYYFCEDTSRFVEFDAAREFRSDVPGPFRTRFVEEITAGGFDVDYRPNGRLYE